MGDELNLTILRKTEEAGSQGVDRREFLRRTGIAMTGLTAMVALLDGCPGSDNNSDQNLLLVAVLQARIDLGNLHKQAFAARNPNKAILLGWMNALNLILAGVWFLLLQASQADLGESVHPAMNPFLGGLGGSILFAGAVPVYTLALLIAATGTTEDLLGSLPFRAIRGMWIFMALLALMLPTLGNTALLGLAKKAMAADSDDVAGRIFDAFLGNWATGIGKPAVFIAAALVLYSIMGTHLNGQADLMLGPQLGSLLMLMLLLAFLLTSP